MKEAAQRPADRAASRTFELNVTELFRNRFAMKEAAPMPAPPTGQRRPPPRPTAAPPRRKGGGGGGGGGRAPSPPATWSVEESIWGGRQFRGFDAQGQPQDRGFYDDDTTVRHAIQCDFGKALGKGLLQGYLLQHDANAPDPETQPGELAVFTAEVEEFFVTHGRLFFMVFDYFSSLGANDDLFHINRDGYDALCRQCGLIVRGSKNCDRAHLDIIFVLVNATEMQRGAQRGVSRSDPARRASSGRDANLTPVKGTRLPAGGALGDSQHGLTRAELMQCLCRIAIARYVLTPKTSRTPKAGKTDVSDALDELFRTIRTKASREVLQDGQRFREENCYTEETDAALRAHEPVLRLLFAKYSRGEGLDGANAKLGKGKSLDSALVTDSDVLMSPGEWICLCRELALIGEDLSMSDARLVFMWSRMRVVDEDDPKRRQRIENLTFWGFLEAIIRVAQSKAMPTEDEVRVSGYAEGGEFLVKLRKDDPFAYRAFLNKNDREWWQQTRQPIASKLSILLSLVMHTLSTNLARWQRSGEVARAKKDGEAQREAVKRTTDQFGSKSPSSPVSQGAEGSGARPNAAAGGMTGWGDGLVEGFAGGDGVLTTESLSNLSDALDQQAGVLGAAATTIQAHSRRFLARLGWKEHRQRAVLIQASFRGFSDRKATSSLSRLPNGPSAAPPTHSPAVATETAVARIFNFKTSASQRSGAVHMSTRKVDQRRVKAGH